MTVKSSNMAPHVKDKIVVGDNIDFSAASAASKVFFVDPDTDYDVISIHVLMTVAYIGAQATTVKVGTVADDDKFAAAQSMGTTAIALGAYATLTKVTETDMDTLKLAAGQPLIISHTQAASQTGEGKVVVKLRPRDKKYQSSKRPGGSAGN